MFKLSFLLFTLLIICSCGNKKEDKSRELRQLKQEMFIKGDLETFYKGMELNKQSVVTVDNVRDLSKFRLLKLGKFFSSGVKQTKKAPQRNQTAQENEKSRQSGQEASKENIPDDSQLIFSFKQSQDQGEWIYSDENNSYQLYFREQGQYLAMTKFVEIDRYGSSKEIKVKPIHYSISDNGLSFSILVESVDQEISSLSLFQFSYADQPSFVEDSKKEYTFLLGPTKKAVIAPKSEIKLCSNVPNWIQRQVKKAFDSWNALLPQGHLSYSVAKNSPPYSDINSKCIYFIRDFNYTDPELDSVSAGFAIVGMHFAKGEIIDSDMIIPVNSWEQVFKARGWGSFDKPDLGNKAAIEDYAYGVISHEIGHMLGLDHSFTHDSKVDSIMDYSADRHFTKYDRESIEELYKDFY